MNEELPNMFTEIQASAIQMHELKVAFEDAGFTEIQSFDLLKLMLELAHKPKTIFG